MACLSSLVDGRSAVEHGLWHSVALSERDAKVARGGGSRIVTLVRRIDLRQALAVDRVRHQSNINCVQVTFRDAVKVQRNVELRISTMQ